MRSIDVTNEYLPVIDRVQFEHSRALSNAAFMLNNHLSDSDDSYLDSDLHKRLIQAVEETLSTRLNTALGVACILIGEDDHGEYSDIGDFNLVFKKDGYTLYCADL